jgi:anthranilate phosphoribosyltransferase
MFADFTTQLRAGQNLGSEQVMAAVRQLTDPALPPEPKADFLAALAIKGESVEEIAGFARELRELSLPVPLSSEIRKREILDVCGTGGDRLNTFNISTTVAILCAAAGVVVAKHGNRAITSQSGSADVLEALGIPVDQTPEQVAHALQERGFAFLFAPRFHPAFKAIAPARKLCAERGQRTIFNLLGPLLNPARPSAQLVGVPRPQWCEPVARTLQTLGVRRGLVVTGEVPTGAESAPAFLDELSTLGPNHVAEFYQERGFGRSTWEPGHFPVKPAALSDLAGGDAVLNAALIQAVLAGRDRGPKRDAVLLNAGAALFVAGAARSIGDGWEMAAATIDRGQATEKLRELAQGRS